MHHIPRYVTLRDVSFCIASGQFPRVQTGLCGYARVRLCQARKRVNMTVTRDREFQYTSVTLDIMTTCKCHICIMCHAIIHVQSKTFSYITCINPNIHDDVSDVRRLRLTSRRYICEICHYVFNHTLELCSTLGLLDALVKISGVYYMKANMRCSGMSHTYTHEHVKSCCTI